MQAFTPHFLFLILTAALVALFYTEPNNARHDEGCV